VPFPSTTICVWRTPLRRGRAEREGCCRCRHVDAAEFHHATRPAPTSLDLPAPSTSVALCGQLTPPTAPVLLAPEIFFRFRIENASDRDPTSTRLDRGRSDSLPASCSATTRWSAIFLSVLDRESERSRSNFKAGSTNLRAFISVLDRELVRSRSSFASPRLASPRLASPRLASVERGPRGPIFSLFFGKKKLSGLVVAGM
jgi:hypothetical protein